MPSWHIPPLLLLAGSIAGALVVLAWRVRESRSPVTMRKIVAPPLGMSTGLSMFLLRAARIPWSWAAAAFLLGAVVLAVPMVRTTVLVRQSGVVMMQRSRAFLWILLGLVVIRFALRAYVEQYVSPIQTGSIFFLLAFGMILRWRVGMALVYRRLMAPKSAEHPAK